MENLLHASTLGSVSLAIFDIPWLAEASLQSLPSPSYDILPVCVCVHISPHYNDSGHIGLEAQPILV